MHLMQEFSCPSSPITSGKVDLHSKHGSAAVAQVPVPVSPTHLLCVPGQWTAGEPAAVLHAPPLGIQQAAGPQDLL